MEGTKETISANLISDRSDDGLAESVPSWEEMYGRLKKLKETTGLANLPQQGIHEPVLQSWICEQRRQCRLAREKPKEHDDSENTSPVHKKKSIFADLDEHQLTFERILELEQLEFSWDSPHEMEWKKRYEELKKYKDRFGHCRVPARDKEFPELGRWVMTQRRQFALARQGKKSRMSRERQQMLDHIGFDWVLREDYKEKWNQKLAELRDFFSKNGHFDVGKVLGSKCELFEWVSRMKKQYKSYVEGISGSHNLSSERFLALKNLGFHKFVLSECEVTSNSDSYTLDFATSHESVTLSKNLDTRLENEEYDNCCKLSMEEDETISSESINDLCITSNSDSPSNKLRMGSKHSFRLPSGRQHMHRSSSQSGYRSVLEPDFPSQNTSTGLCHSYRLFTDNDAFSMPIRSQIRNKKSLLGLRKRSRTTSGFDNLSSYRAARARLLQESIIAREYNSGVLLPARRVVYVPCVVGEEYTPMGPKQVLMRPITQSNSKLLMTPYLQHF